MIPVSTYFLVLVMAAFIVLGCWLHLTSPLEGEEPEEEPAGGVISFPPGTVWLDVETGEFTREED